jgi:translation initiation factor IF-2
VLRQLSDDEKDARTRALIDSRQREADERAKAEQAAVVEVVTLEQRTKELKDAEERKLKEDARHEAEAKARKVGEETVRKHLLKEEVEEPARSPDARHKKSPVAPRRGEERRVRGRLTITNALDEEQRQRSLASLKRRQERQKKQITGPLAQQKIQRDVVVPEVITIQELANRMAERGADVIKFLMRDGEMRKITDVIDADTAQLVAEEFGHTVRRVSEADVEEGFIGEEDHSEDLQPRAPIVTIMGHVDHGKTSLLDAIRTTNVVSQEAGGITQHIGAYQVVTPLGNKITFIDTPGHEAFTAMRQRGAQVTDIVVLVVAADDGVKPQTIEAINHAKAAGVPMIVAINKIDKQGADPQRVRTELLSQEIVVESLGGDTLEIEVSALKKTGLDKLLEAIALQAEVLELTANPNRAAEGVIVEAKLERGRGPVGTALIQRGTLHLGDLVVAGSAYGRVRALINELGEQVASAGPSVPVEVLGFDSAPEAGDQFAVVENEARAREITDYRMRERRKRLAVAGQRGSLEQMMNNLKIAGTKEFTLLVKGDVQGSVEAIVAALDKMGTDEVRARIIHAGVGGITESDVGLAATSGAVVLGFNVRANSQAREAAERDGVEIRYYAVIYDLVDEVKQAMSGLLAPTRRETFLGNAEILEVFTISKVGKVAGCRVTEGKVERGAHVRLIRDNVVIHEGKLSTLKRFKDEVREVIAGQECGMAFEGYQDMRPGDVIECFEVEHVQRTL